MTKFKAPALAKGLDIIDLIRENGPLSFNEIQHHTQGNPASLSRYLHTLMAKDYLLKLPNQKYALGLKLIDLNNTKNLWPSLIDLCHPLMERINKEFNVTVLLLAYTKDHFTVINKVIAPDNLGMMAVKTVGPNKIDDQWSNQLYNIDLDDNTILSLSHIHKPNYNIDTALISIQQNGYMEWTGKQIIRMGFPIRYNNRVVATIGIGSLCALLEDEPKEAIAKLIMTQIKVVEDKMMKVVY